MSLRWVLFGEAESNSEPSANIPNGRIVEGPWTIQCVCPVCPYGTGYNEPILRAVYERRPVTCLTCQLTFMGLV
jgi:hypothetical protein